MQNEHKLVIIGSGPAALTAGVYASRANLEPLIIEGREPGGLLMGTSYVENWPGNISILGHELVMNMRKHAKAYGSQFLSGQVVSVDFSSCPFILTTDKKEQVSAQAVIIATGANPKKLGCKGEDKFWGKGVSSCAVCDGAFFKDLPVVVVGGGDSAMEVALFLRNYTDKITVVHILPELTASHAMQSRILCDNNIKIIYNSTVTEILGDDKVSGVTITNQQTHERTQLDVKGVFIAIGLTPNTQIFKGQLELNHYGYINLKHHTQTSVPGVFAAGDVADYRYRQAITSAGSGCMAALDAERYLKGHL